MDTVNKKKTVGYFMIDNNLVEGGTLAALSSAALKVYIVLTRLSNSGKKEAYPSYTKMQEYTGLSSRGSIANGVAELIACGLIQQTSTGSNLTNKANRYSVISTAISASIATKAKAYKPAKTAKAPKAASTPTPTKAILPTNVTPTVTTVAAPTPVEASESEDMTTDMVNVVYLLANSVYEAARAKNITSVGRNEWIGIMIKKDRTEYANTVEYLNSLLEAEPEEEEDIPF